MSHPGCLPKGPEHLKGEAFGHRVVRLRAAPLLCWCLRAPKCPCRTPPPLLWGYAMLCLFVACAAFPLCGALAIFPLSGGCVLP